VGWRGGGGSGEFGGLRGGHFGGCGEGAEMEGFDGWVVEFGYNAWEVEIA